MASRLTSRRLGGVRWRTLLGAAAVLGLLTAYAAAPVGAQTSTGHAARTLYLNESGHLLHLTSHHHGFTFNEQGSASGTIRGTIYIHLTVSSTNHVSAEVNIYPSGGSLTGYASASYATHGATASFDGSLRIARGTGGYAHGHGSGLAFSGTIQRSNDAVTVHLSGRMYD